MATLRGFNRRFYLSARTYEGVWGTAEAETDLCPFRLDSDAFRVLPEFAADTDLVGGSEEATSQQELARVVRGTISQSRVQPHLLAAIAAFGMASSVTSTKVDTSAYRHDIIPNKSDSGLRSFTALDLFSSSDYLEYIGCMVDRFTLSCAHKGWLGLSAVIVGSGKTVTNGLSVASLGKAVTETYLKAGDAHVFRTTSPSGNLPGTYTQASEDIQGTAADITSKIVSFEWIYDNNIEQDELYELESGLYLGRAERDRREQSLGFTVEFEDLSCLDYLIGQTELAMEFDFNSAALAGASTVCYGIQVVFPSLLLIACRMTGGTGKIRAHCEAKVLENDEPTPDPTATLSVWNKQGSYLTT